MWGFFNGKRTRLPSVVLFRLACAGNPAGPPPVEWDAFPFSNLERPMDDRKTPLPKSPFTEALKSNPKDNAREAERLLDSPDRREVTDANRAAAPSDKPRTGQDPLTTQNMRKPI